MNNHEDIFPVLNKIDRVLQKTPHTIGEFLYDFQVNYVKGSIRDCTNEDLSRYLDIYIKDKGLELL